MDRDAVGVVAQSYDGQQDELLEIAERHAAHGLPSRLEVGRGHPHDTYFLRYVQEMDPACRRLQTDYPERGLEGRTAVVPGW